MRAGMRAAIPLALVSALILILAGDILHWYRLERRPSPTANNVPRIKWTRTADGSVVATAPLAGSDGTLYVASGLAIQAVDPSSAMKWIYRLQASDPIQGATLSQDAAGNLYFTTRNVLYSLFPSGLKRWQFDCRNAALARNPEGNPFQDNAVYASCDDGLVAVNESDGHEIWSLPNLATQTPGLVPTAPLMLHNGELIFSRQRLIATDREGNTLWNYPSDPSGAYLLGMGRSDIIYARKFSGELVALDAEGHETWTFSRRPSVALTETPVTSPDGTLYAVGMQGPLFALSPDGTPKWSFTLPPSTAIQGYSSPLLSPDGVIYQALEDSVIALSPQGKVIWQMQLPGEPRHRAFLALAPDSTLYAVRDNSAVYAIQTRNSR